ASRVTLPSLSCGLSASSLPGSTAPASPPLSLPPPPADPLGRPHPPRSPRFAGLPPTADPGSRLHLDARLLGLRRRRLLLGAWHLGRAADGRLSLDPGLLGLARGRLCLERRLLGPAHRLLRRPPFQVPLLRRR